MSDKGGAAFPLAFTNEDGAVYAHDGMTLRDYFAAKAMQGLLVATFKAYEGGAPADSGDMEKCARAAYKMADAMLLERDR